MPGHVRKLSVTWGYVIVFARYSLNMVEKVTIVKVPIISSRRYSNLLFMELYFLAMHFK